jgi:hypothetical protein
VTVRVERGGRTVTEDLDRHVELRPRAHPGTQAPLGWALSEPSRRSLREQLAEGNAKGLENVGRWFSDTVRCHGGGGRAVSRRRGR